MLQLINDGETTLAVEIDATTTSLTVTDGSVFPQLTKPGQWFPLVFIQSSSIERMRVIERDGNWLSVIRHAEGTTAVSWAVESICSSELTESAIKSLSAFALAELSGGTVVNRLDENGNHNIMLKIPMFTRDSINTRLGVDIGTGPHPAFIDAEGDVLTHFEYAIYTASNDGAGNPVSIPGGDPYVSVNFTDAKAKCAAMGQGWHLSSNAEWAAIVWLCIANGKSNWAADWEVTGNTFHGINHSKQYQAGIRPDGFRPGDVAGEGRTLTGSGPVTWRHDGTLSGLADLVGNVGEWQDGFKQVNGQVIVAYRNAMEEADWLGLTAYYDIAGKLGPARIADNADISVLWAEQEKDSGYAENTLLKALIIEPVALFDPLKGYLFCNNTITSYPVRGGNFAMGYQAGLASLNLLNIDTTSDESIGFRPAFIG
jgi:hypothetical protein